MLSWTKGTPIAIIYDGSKPTDKVIYLDKGPKDDNEIMTCNNPFSLLDEKFFIISGTRTLKYREREKLRDALVNKNPPSDKFLMPFYEKALKIINNKLKNEILIDGLHLHVVPIPADDKEKGKERECLYITAPSGGGKSTYAGYYINEYKYMYPNRKFYLFSRLDEDEALDDLKPLRIKIGKELIKKQFTPDDFKKSVVLFDDIDTLPEIEKSDTEDENEPPKRGRKRKKKMKVDMSLVVQKIRDDLLETGRKKQVSVVCTSHQMTNYNKTKIMLTECHAVTFFPQTGLCKIITRFLKDYCNFNKEQIKKIFSLPSRYVTVYRTFPIYVLHEKGVYLVNTNQEMNDDKKSNDNLYTSMKKPSKSEKYISEVLKDIVSDNSDSDSGSESGGSVNSKSSASSDSSYKKNRYKKPRKSREMYKHRESKSKHYKEKSDSDNGSQTDNDSDRSHSKNDSKSDQGAGYTDDDQSSSDDEQSPQYQEFDENLFSN